jgi:hypothetical protein
VRCLVLLRLRLRLRLRGMVLLLGPGQGGQQVRSGGWVEGGGPDPMHWGPLLGTHWGWLWGARVEQKAARDPCKLREGQPPVNVGVEPAQQTQNIGGSMTPCHRIGRS